jgi:hypothetical protein
LFVLRRFILKECLCTHVLMRVTLDSIVLGTNLVAHNNLVVINCCAFDEVELGI